VSVDVANESGVDVDVDRLRQLCRFVLAAMRIHPRAELAVLCVDVDTMSTLHKRFMDESGPTDVLSFPMDELRPAKEGEEAPQGLLGDIVLCPEVARQQGDTAGHGYVAEVDLLCVHGLLHLLGYDHAEDQDQKEMFGLQKHLLSDWRTSLGETVADAMAAAPQVPPEHGTEDASDRPSSPSS
jgi:probable rRNA maturation factor